MVTTTLIVQLEKLFAEYNEQVDQAVEMGNEERVPALTASYDNAAVQLVRESEAKQLAFPLPRIPEDPHTSLGKRMLRRLILVHPRT